MGAHPTAVFLGELIIEVYDPAAMNVLIKSPKVSERNIKYYKAHGLGYAKWIPSSVFPDYFFS